MISFLVGIFIGVLLALPFILDYSAEVDMLKEANKELLSRVKVDYDVKEVNTKINEPKLSPYSSMEKLQRTIALNRKKYKESINNAIESVGKADKMLQTKESDCKRKKNAKVPKSKGNKARK